VKLQLPPQVFERDLLPPGMEAQALHGAARVVEGLVGPDWGPYEETDAEFIARGIFQIVPREPTMQGWRAELLRAGTPEWMVKCIFQVRFPEEPGFVLVRKHEGGSFFELDRGRLVAVKLPYDRLPPLYTFRLNADLSSSSARFDPYSEGARGRDAH
jgi:hypothetical protein